uniref:BPTI/Kunitz inhibitor domain-containing protein n=1 Tax=Romanomermis culicivorax TaxID=13658 RepID=A0A915IGN6_ROMCU
MILLDFGIPFVTKKLSDFAAIFFRLRVKSDLLILVVGYNEVVISDVNCRRLDYDRRCPDGRSSQFTIRWFKDEKSHQCRSYPFGYCPEDVSALARRTFRSKQDCEKRCLLNDGNENDEDEVENADNEKDQISTKNTVKSDHFSSSCINKTSNSSLALKTTLIKTDEFYFVASQDDQETENRGSKVKNNFLIHQASLATCNKLVTVLKNTFYPTLASVLSVQYYIYTNLSFASIGVRLNLASSVEGKKSLLGVCPNLTSIPNLASNVS